MNREELMTLLPHRDGMLLLDQLDKEGEMAHGQYHVRGDEWFLQGHFPDAPVVPGVILCVALHRFRYSWCPVPIPHMVS